jgi:hypothetical protein
MVQLDIVRINQKGENRFSSMILSIHEKVRRTLVQVRSGTEEIPYFILFVSKQHTNNCVTRSISTPSI